jgi:hypothetical protein
LSRFFFGARLRVLGPERFSTGDWDDGGATVGVSEARMTSPGTKDLEARLLKCPDDFEFCQLRDPLAHGEDQPGHLRRSRTSLDDRTLRVPVLDEVLPDPGCDPEACRRRLRASWRRTWVRR